MTLDERKRAAMAFYDLMFNKCRPREAIEQYVGDRYIQHNPDVGDGKDAFVEYFERMAREYHGKRVEFRRAIAEGDLRRPQARRFRFDDNDEIVEHWDVLQVIPPTSKNDNGML